MGTRGPVPKRSEQRRRANQPSTPVVKAEAGAVTSQPAGEEYWHPIAAAWYRSLADSGQSRFYEPSDWATARVVTEAMHRDLTHLMVIPPAAVTAYLKAATALLATEADRRRLSVELQRPKPASPSEVPDGVADFAAYQSRLAESG